MSEIDHKNRKHALLSASGSERWLNCTPSARLEEKFEESSSVYGEEGTLAHEFAEIMVRHELGELNKKEFNRQMKELRSHSLYSDEMEPEVQKYVDIIMGDYESKLTENGSAIALVEQRLDFSHIVEKGFGTGDTVIISDGVMDITDLKYGRGVRVHAEGNSQLMLYGLGALRNFDMMFDIHTVKLNIVQPRLDHYDSWVIKVSDLKNWAESWVKPQAAKAYLGEGKQIAGEWCKWCKVKAMCRALADYNIELAKHEFADPQLLSKGEILGIYKQIPMLTDWANAVSAHMLDKALGGEKWEGYKLVEGRSLRKWSDEDSVISQLKKLRIPAKDIFKKTLIGIPAVEKLVDKEKFKENISPYVIKPQGSPTLVPESDRRPALGIEQAKIDFKD